MKIKELGIIVPIDNNKKDTETQYKIYCETPIQQTHELFHGYYKNYQIRGVKIIRELGNNEYICNIDDITELHTVKVDFDKLKDLLKLSLNNELKTSQTLGTIIDCSYKSNTNYKIINLDSLNKRMKENTYTDLIDIIMKVVV